MFQFTKEMMVSALEANGWRRLWTDNNWVHNTAVNPDTAGTTLEHAFKTLLKRKNLI